MIIESFRVVCTADDAPLAELTTVFGYFPRSAFDDQQGCRSRPRSAPVSTSPATEWST